MTSSLLDELVVLIQRATVEDLESLDGANAAWLPRLGTLPSEMVVQEIRHALEASPDTTVFRERLAWLYTWLMHTRHVSPWLLLHFGAPARRVNPLRLIEDLADVLRSLPFETTIGVWRGIGTYYVCIVNNYSSSTNQECGAIFLVLWAGRPFGAAYARTYSQLLMLTAALHVALRLEGVALMPEVYADLGAAYSAGRQDVTAVLMSQSDAAARIVVQFIWHFYQLRHSSATWGLDGAP